MLKDIRPDGVAAATERLGAFSETPQAQMCQVVAKTVAEVLNVDVGEIQPATELLALGAQSMDFVSLVSQLERIHHVRIPRVFAIPHPYMVKDLAQAVCRELARERPTVTEEARPRVEP